MKTLLFILFCSQAFAFPTLQDADQFISEQLTLPDSELNQKINVLKSTVKLMGTTVFLPQEPGILFEKSFQSAEDCAAPQCYLYQRKVYSKISSFRTDYFKNRNHSIWIQWVEIVISFNKIWTLDSDKYPLDLVQDQYKVEGVYFYSQSL